MFVLYVSEPAGAQQSMVLVSIPPETMVSCPEKKTGVQAKEVQGNPKRNEEKKIAVYCSTVDIFLYLKCIMQSCFPPENVYCSALSHKITTALITNCKNTTSSTFVISRRLKKK